MAVFAYIATFFTFAALALEVFTLLGNTYNVVLLRDLYFARLTLSDRFIQFGLWNYCIGKDGAVTHCSTPKPAFVWTEAEGLDRLIQGLEGMDKVFLTNFILYWVVFGLTLLALAITITTHFRRTSDLLASFAMFIAFLVMLVVLIIVLVISIRGINSAKGSDRSASGFPGPAMWMTVGAMGGLLISSFWYCVTCCFGPRRKVADGDEKPSPARGCLPLLLPFLLWRGTR
ncbi:SUR7/PalI family-domain-containing protein [Radiomyces spectabilis]|uniref:SUR7/PalI family-domain-containing protein n=1 Tax=Radiomyces spectabilis TaxID=64574 RepID=UPI0022202C4A|nr:SUR7/PalI family-domain-containing protein [Radiomyces spectabilis]KAI8366108.1 SUR7/PalI family-domain-containing protein [Radiomyces spectabilis]